MQSDVIEKTIDQVNRALSKFGRMDCVAVWRSVGSNIFFEFGIPTIKRVTPKTRKPFTVVRGEVAIGVHADNWRLRVGPNEILTSDVVNDANLSKIAREFFHGIPMPKFAIGCDGVLELSFERSISFRIERNDYVDIACDAADEVTVNFPDFGFRFNYKRGFYPVFDE